jgi:hypothetical protein
MRSPIVILAIEPEDDTREPRSCIFVGLTHPVTREAGPMICPFCKQEVDEPCHNTVEMQRRARDHVERCDKALKSLKGVKYS